jgi:hypothetical protein
VVPLDEIGRRLATDPTSGRRDDLAASVAWVEESSATSLADHIVQNDRGVRDIAVDILRWLGWSTPAGR